MKNQNIENRTKEMLEEEKERLLLKPEHISVLMKKEFPDIEWIVEDLIPCGTVVVFSGAPATYKTWIVLHMLKNIALGTPVFGKFETKKAGLLLVDEESGERLLRRRMDASGFSEDLPVHYMSIAGFRVSEETVDDLIEYCQENDISFVVFDSLVRIHNGDENDAKAMSGVFRLIQRFKKENITVLLTHHHRKRGGFGGGDLSQEIRGSSDILAAVDVHIAVRKKDEHIAMHQTKMRHKEEITPCKINVVSDGENFDLVYGGEIDEIVDKKELSKKAIIDYLELNTEPIYTSALHKLLASTGLEAGYNTYNKAVKELVKAGKIYQVKGERNKKYLTIVPEQENEEMSL